MFHYPIVARSLCGVYSTLYIKCSVYLKVTTCTCILCMHITVFHMYTQPNKCMRVTHSIFWISRLEAEFFYERDPNVLLQTTKLVTS